MKNQSNMNLYELIEATRKQLYEGRNAIIANTNAINVFNEVKPLTASEFQTELLKYNVSLDDSYVEEIVFQINLELAMKLMNKVKENILRNIVNSSDGVIELLTAEKLTQKYGINLQDKYMKEIIEFVNIGIKSANIKRKNVILNKQSEVKSFDSPVEDGFFSDFPGYNRLYECFIELAKTDVQKDAIDKIMRYGKYKNFKLNSMLSNERNDRKAEIKRRITFAEMILYDEKLFFYLANNELNVFHGTKIDALQDILSNGLLSSFNLEENEIQLRTGEEHATKTIFNNNSTLKRNFISLTDDFINAALYAEFHYEEQIEYSKENYGTDLTNTEDIPIIICFNGTIIGQKYSESLVYVRSTCNEIGVSSSIEPSDIKCIITTYDKIDYVKSIVSNYEIEVLGYDLNNKFEKRLISGKKGKFYDIFYSKIEVDEQEFEKLKESIKNNNVDSRGNLSEDSSRQNAPYVTYAFDDEISEILYKINKH